MGLNPDLYYDVVLEIFKFGFDPMNYQGMHYMNIFILSGKEPLIFSQDFAKEIDSVMYWRREEEEVGANYVCHSLILRQVSTLIIIWVVIRTYRMVYLLR